MQREFWYLAGEERLGPLFSERWVRFETSQEGCLIAHYTRRPQEIGKLCDIDGTNYQLWRGSSFQVQNSAHSLVNQETIAGLPRPLWSPVEGQQPNSELLRNGGWIVSGFFQVCKQHSEAMDAFIGFLMTPGRSELLGADPRPRVVLLIEAPAFPAQAPEVARSFNADPNRFRRRKPSELDAPEPDVDRLMNLGFGRDMVLAAYQACDRNVEMAANHLFNMSSPSRSAM